MDFKSLITQVEEDLAKERDPVPRCSLERRTILAIGEWLSTATDRDQIEEILVLLQRSGVDRQSSQVLFPEIRKFVLSSMNTDAAVPGLWVVGDMLEYIEPDKQFIHELALSTEVEKETRAYKLAKSTLLSRIITDNRYKKYFDEIHDWMRQIFTSKDTEYIDLLAFSIASEKVKLTEELIHIFHDYIQENKLADASAEMAVSLARLKDPFVYDYIVEALGDEPGDPWVEAAILYGDKKLMKKLHDTIDPQRIKKLSFSLV